MTTEMVTQALLRAQWAENDELTCFADFVLIITDLNFAQLWAVLIQHCYKWCRNPHQKRSKGKESSCLYAQLPRVAYWDRTSALGLHRRSIAGATLKAHTGQPFWPFCKRQKALWNLIESIKRKGLYFWGHLTRSSQSNERLKKT